MSRTEHPHDEGSGPDVCGVCPICIAARALGDVRPEVVEHLTEAARHLAAALRTVVDAADAADAADAGDAADPADGAAAAGGAEGAAATGAARATGAPSGAAADDDAPATASDDAHEDAGGGHRPGEVPTIRGRRPARGSHATGSRQVRRIELD